MSTNPERLFVRRIKNHDGEEDIALCHLDYESRQQSVLLMDRRTALYAVYLIMTGIAKHEEVDPSGKAVADPHGDILEKEYEQKIAFISNAASGALSIEKMRNALEFYADQETYSATHIPSRGFDVSNAAIDRGARAREALGIRK